MSTGPPQTRNLSKEGVIKYYFHQGYSYSEILLFLRIYHESTITKRQLHRLLRKQGLFRRYRKSSLNDVIPAIEREINERSGRCFGYRMMTQKLRSQGFTVDRETVRLCIKELDPSGVNDRRNHRLHRRLYVAPGPNFIWHIDGYDKLVPFGFGIHGAIDGYSRRILWLRVHGTNSDPKLIASYYLDYIQSNNVLPRCVRADRGSENIVLCGMQRFMRRNGTDSASRKNSFIFGPSTRNQRIESWWSIFKRSRAIWWINFLKDLCDEGIYDPGLQYHKDCFRFSFMGLIQKELDETKALWNSHRIRKVHNTEGPSGRPNVLYFTQPDKDRKFPIRADDLDICEQLLNENPLPAGLSEEMLELCEILMYQHGFSEPHTASAGKQLFIDLIHLIDAL